MATTSTVPDNLRAYRLPSIDLLRGLIVVIMALDHVRDFTMAGAMQDPTTDPHASAALFFTRWITHFCAPVFIFLAGTSAGLMTGRRTPAQLGRFLLGRGLWLLLVEVLVVSSAITLAPFTGGNEAGQVVVIIQTLSAIGVGMIVLSVAQWLGTGFCLSAGLLIVLGHNLLDGVWPQNGFGDPQLPLWAALHTSMRYRIGMFDLILIYPFLPWTGVMLTGFGSATLFRLDAAERNRLLCRIGMAMIAAFVLLRGLDLYGDPRHWQAVPGDLSRDVINFLNTSKYPPSLDYLLMTLGPAALLCAIADRLRGWLADTLIMFGKVPFAFYVTHFYLAHGLGLLIGLTEGYSLPQILQGRHHVADAGVSLVGVYLVWIVVVALLYPLCRWVAGVKARSHAWWLSYV